MSRRSMGAAVAALASLALAAPAAADPQDPINGYRVKDTPANAELLAQAGFDVTEGKRGSIIEIYGSKGQIAAIRKQGVRVRAVRDRKGRTAAGRQIARMAQDADVADDSSYQVWTRYDRVRGDGKEQYVEQYDRLLRQYPRITKRVKLGESIQGRDIVAIKVSRNASRQPDGRKPAVLYNAMQHAREWLAGETCRRTLDYFTTNYGANARVTRLVDSRELWFLCMVNPDGYEYTFTPGNRLWRKNMADNNGNGIRGEVGDGVDLNRNHATNWGLDNEGSSDDPADETYRGPRPDSEPETRAYKRLWERVDFSFMKNDHTAAALLLYPYGFQKFTPTADNPIFEALAGTDGNSAIQDDEESFDPDLSSELYITNGDALDDAYTQEGILGFTPEGTPSRVPGVTGFEFEDDEQEVQEEFLRHLPFSIDLAESAEDPEDPESHLGNRTEDFYVDEFPLSYGDPQPVQVTAKRSLGPIFMHYRINGGREQRVRTREWAGGERYYREQGVYYARMRGVVEGTRPGDEVTVWFENANGRERSDRFTYEARSESRRRVLVMADENYSGPVPAYTDTSGPSYVDYYLDALQANGIRADVYDIDAEEMTAAHPLGVLSHYDAVIWYTGDDEVTRRPGQPGQTGQARVAIETQLAVRDHINEGGKLFVTGAHALQQSAAAPLYEFRNFGFAEPDEAADGRWCSGGEPEAVDGCIAPDNDFLQYYLGAYLYVSDGGTDPDGEPWPVEGETDPFGPLTWDFNGEDSAQNQDHTAAFLVTSSILDPEQYPTFADSRRLAGWSRPGGAPFEPFTGEYFAAAGADDQSYKRLSRTIDLTGRTSGELSFRTSYDLEGDYDYMFVEARTVGQDDWTTLPDANGHTSDDVGFSCLTQGDGSAWQTLHPWLARYQTVTEDGEACEPTGTSGEWNAATGNSAGWQDWSIDLSQYAGQQVEVSITVATDPAVLGLGVWVDDTVVTADGTTLAETSFETDEGGWTAGPPPEGTESQESGWTRAQTEFVEGAMVGTDDTAYAGFGFEGISGADTRAQVMRGVLEHLGILGPGTPGRTKR